MSRLLQETVVDPTNNSLILDDPSKLLADAEANLIKAVARATGTDSNDLVIDYHETTVANLNSAGVYEVQAAPTSGSSSRLLEALFRARMLEEWDTIFADITSKVVENTVSSSVSVIKEYGPLVAEAAQISFTANEELKVAT